MFKKAAPLGRYISPRYLESPNLQEALVPRYRVPKPGGDGSPARIPGGVFSQILAGPSHELEKPKMGPRRFQGKLGW